MIKNRISEIDALRGIACLMVVLNHFGNFTQLSSLGFEIGCIGVDLFFIISGFVILLTIENNSEWKYFLINRFSRLFPTYWICLILSVISMAISYNVLNEKAPDMYYLKTFIANLSMFQFYLNFPNIDGSYWTLIIELLFYFFIFLFLFTKKKHLIELFGAISLLFPLCLIIFNKSIFSNPKIHHLIDCIPLLPYFPLFYSGILFYKMKFHQKKTLRWILLLFCFILQLSLFENFYNNRPELTFTQYLVTLSIIYGAFILYLYNRLSFIANQITIWLGSISYCLYLIHQSIGTQVILPFLNNYLSINFYLAFLLSISLLLLISTLILKYIEKPSISYLRSKYPFKPEIAIN